MMQARDREWIDGNQRYSMAALEEVRAAVHRLLNPHAGDEHGPVPELPGDVENPALETLCNTFELSSFERRVLLMCAGVEWDSRFAALCASAQGDAHRATPTFSLALAAFDDAHWSALSPSHALRYWRLIRTGAGDSVTTAPLRIDERILHYLAGIVCIDEEVRAIVTPVAAPEWLPPSHQSVVAQIVMEWSGRRGEAGLPVVQLPGGEAVGKRAIAAAAAAELGLSLHALGARRIPAGGPERDTFRRIWEREAVLSSSALLVECDGSEGGDAPADEGVSWLIEHVRSPLFVSSLTPRACAHRQHAIFEIGKPTSAEQAEIWTRVLEPEFGSLNGKVTALTSQFSLGAATISSVVKQAKRDAEGQAGLGPALWDACRVHSRPRLEGMAQRIDAGASWEDLVVPEKQRDILRQIAIQIRNRGRVYDEWGFGARNTRGLGISALFAGPSGTGKTMAAEVLADELRLDLYRIDLSQIVSKYIGETEKNLRGVFDAADEGAAILLFDEADALFGKRSEIKDSHDRYANIEISYLLQRMETYRGLAILTTNRKSALDQAFLRRIRFVVEFPFPELAQRMQMWRRVFPAATPTEGLSVERLSQLHASGAHIRNIAMGAAFLAADSGEPVRMEHVLAAARQEFTKLEKPLTDAEIAGWM
jgi:hypothetical protein